MRTDADDMDVTVHAHGTPIRVTAPTFRARVQLMLVAIGQITCRHSYVLVTEPTRMWLRCDRCGRTTEGFTIAGSGSNDAETK